MELKNCKDCGDLFAGGAGKVRCAKCREVFAESAQQVKDYLYTHPKANADEIHMFTGVSMDIIVEMLRDNKIY